MEPVWYVRRSRQEYFAAAATRADREDTEDVRQEASVRLLRSDAAPRVLFDDINGDVLILRGREDCDPLSYVRTVARNHMIDERRRRGRRPAVVELECALDPDHPGPVDEVAAQEFRERVLKAVGLLTLPQREVLALHLEGRSHDEIAGLLGFEEGEKGAAKSRDLLRRARESLGRSLGIGR